MLFGEITCEGKVRLNSGHIRCFAIPVGWRLLAKTCQEQTALCPNPYRSQLLLQLRAFLFEYLLRFRHPFIQRTGFVLTQVAKLVLETFRQTIQRFDYGDEVHLQRLMQRTQLHEFRLVAEPQGRPVLAQDEAARVFRDLLQRNNAARDLHPINTGVSV